MDNSILSELKFDDARGALLYKDVRYLLIRPETLIAFQKAAEEKLGAGADELLYAGGFTGGSLSAKRYREVFGLSDAQSVEFMAQMGAQIGWGKITVSRFDVSSCTLELVVESSPFAAAYGKSERGVCHLIRGVFAGLASGIFSRAVESREEECLAMGHARCKFVIRVVKDVRTRLSL
jgi:predicted hydrocarbon binding protein